MKRFLVLIVVLIVLADGLIFGYMYWGGSEPESGQGITKEEVKNEVGEAVDAVIGDAQQHREEFERRIQRELDAYDERMEAMAGRAEELTETAREEFDEQMNDLREKQNAAAEKLGELGPSSEEAWDDLEEGMKAALKELEKAYKKAESRFD